MTTPAFTTRTWRTWRARSTAWVDWRSGAGADHRGAFSMPPAVSLPTFLAYLPADAERVFVVGPRMGDGTPDGLREWLFDTGTHWHASPQGHYLEDLAQFTLRFTANATGRRVTIHRAASWFGEGDYSPADVAAAWNYLAQRVGQVFDGGALLDTPATTGRDLFVRGLGDHCFPLASPEHQDLIRATTGQGRIQLLPHDPDDDPPGRRGAMPGLAEYDGRLMYGALCWGLGSGVVADDQAAGPGGWAAFASDFRHFPMRRARYQVRFTVPRGWAHVGLCGAWTCSSWAYPDQPGETAETWVDGSELALMARSRWPFTILRRLTLGAPVGAGPLDRWAKKLVELRLSLTRTGDHLAAAGARAIMLHAIGAFFGRPHMVTRTCPLDDARRVPMAARGVRIEGDSIVWGEPRPPAWPELSHPEWAAAIWARARTRLLTGPGGTGALHVERSGVVAFRTDAVYLTARQDWADDGKAGRLRLAGWTPGPLPWPRSVVELLSLRDRGRA